MALKLYVYLIYFLSYTKVYDDVILLLKFVPIFVFGITFDMLKIEYLLFLLNVANPH